jgi:hypothetical protein
MDGSRTMIMTAEISKSAAATHSVDTPTEVAVTTRDLESVLNPFLGQFDQADAHLRLRFRSSGLEVNFRVGDELVRSKLMHDIPDAHFTTPKLKGVDSAPSALLGGLERLTLASTTFPESADLEISLKDGHLQVQASNEDALTLKAETSGSSRSRVHHRIFRIASRIGQLATLQKIRITVVDDGICHFNFDFGRLGMVSYFVAPLVETEKS